MPNLRLARRSATVPSLATGLAALTALTALTAFTALIIAACQETIAPPRPAGST
jgi:hypothetical protein